VVTENNPSLLAQLKAAEEAEMEVRRLETLASQAPSLRAELAKAQRHDNRNQNRNAARAQAIKAIEAAAEKQREVPGTLETVAKMVYSLYSVLKGIDADRREATRYMAIVDQVDYEEELEYGEEEQREMGRDSKSLEYLIASRHGQAKVKQLVEEMDSTFSFLRDCHLEEPLRRDVANFILAHVVSPDQVAHDKVSPDRAVEPPAPEA
jgi:acyl-CoA-binding protein